jgi:proline iminopeptidase
MHKLTITLLVVAILLPLCLGARAVGNKGIARHSLAQGEFITKINGLKLWYKVSGRGPVCLMPNPAWGPGCSYYMPVFKPLESYFTMVYLENRGTGQSERAKSTKEYTWDHLVADMDALRVHLKQDKVWLMGHSEGGALILQYAVKHQDKVRGLVLLEAVAAEDDLWGADVQARAMRRKDQPWFEEAMKADAATPTTDSEFQQILAKSLPLYWCDPSKIVDHQAVFKSMSVSVEAFKGMQDSKRTSFDTTQQLRDVTVPALIVVGDDDYICSPATAQRIHLSLRNSKLLLIEKSGHFPWLEQSKAFFEGVPLFLEALGVRKQTD